MSDPDLQRIVNEDYRPESTEGNGGTADAIEQEIETGEPVGGKEHITKGRQLRNRYDKWIRRQLNTYPVENRASEKDIETAIQLHNQLIDALKPLEPAGVPYPLPYRHPSNPK